MSNFDKNAIAFDAVPDSKVTPPDSAGAIKVYFNGKDIKQIGFDGKAAPLVTPQEIKVIDAKVTKDTQADASVYTFRIPNTSARLSDLNEKVIAISESIAGFASVKEVVKVSDLVNRNINELKVLLDATEASIQSIKTEQEAYIASQKDVNSSISKNVIAQIAKINDTQEAHQSLIVSLDEKHVAAISNLNSSIEKKLETIYELMTSLNNIVALSATQKQLASEIASVKAAIPKPTEATTIKSGSDNVRIDAQGNEYTISVDIPKVTERVVEKLTTGGGGVNKTAVRNIVYGSDALPEHITYNIDGTINTIVSNVGTKTFSWTAGKLVSIVGTGSYSNKTFSYDINGKLTDIT